MESIAAMCETTFIDMVTTSRPYNRMTDFDRVSDFLMEHHLANNVDGNWLQPAWEYMHHHPALDPAIFEQMRVWEDRGEIVAVCHPEWFFGEAFLQLAPECGNLKAEIVDHAEANLRGRIPAAGTVGAVCLSDPIRVSRPAILSASDTASLMSWERKFRTRGHILTARSSSASVPGL